MSYQTYEDLKASIDNLYHDEWLTVEHVADEAELPIFIIELILDNKG